MKKIETLKRVSRLVGFGIAQTDSLCYKEVLRQCRKKSI